VSSLIGKTALVTGGGRGVGRAIAERLGEHGAVVAVHYGFNAEAADETVSSIRKAGGKAFAVQSDLGTDGCAETLWSAFDAQVREHAERPGVDILVNNAGVTPYEEIEQVTAESYDKVFAINTRAPFFVVREGLSRMRDGGRIINITSGSSRIAMPGIVAYGMTKAALDNLTLSLAKHLGGRNITVNGVALGYVDTDMTAWLHDAPDMMQFAKGVSVFGRLGQPDDVAGVVAFLSSDDARWVTACLIDASGGSGL
jgi:NAD(P)-dependent dehydrogenase (short-subunit alcohol dehydrogenase family)